MQSVEQGLMLDTEWRVFKCRCAWCGY